MYFAPWNRRFIQFLNSTSKRRQRCGSCITPSVEALEVRVVPAKTPVSMGSIVVTAEPNFFTTEDQGTATFTVELTKELRAKTERKAVSLTIP